MPDPSDGLPNPHLVDAFAAALENVSGATTQTIAERQGVNGNAYNSYHIENDSFAETDTFQFYTEVQSTQDNSLVLVTPNIETSGKVQISVVKNPTIDTGLMSQKEFYNLLVGNGDDPDGSVYQSKNVSFSGGTTVSESLFGTAGSPSMNRPPTGGTPQNQVAAVIPPGESLLYNIENLSTGSIDLSYNQTMYENIPEHY